MGFLLDYDSSVGLSEYSPLKTICAKINTHHTIAEEII